MLYKFPLRVAEANESRCESDVLYIVSDFGENFEAGAIGRGKKEADDLAFAKLARRKDKTTARTEVAKPPRLVFAAGGPFDVCGDPKPPFAAAIVIRFQFIIRWHSRLKFQLPYY